MLDFYDILRIKTNKIKNIDSLIDYLNINKNNIIDRYDFLIKKEEFTNIEIQKKLACKNLTNDTYGNKFIFFEIQLDLSSNYYEYFHKYIEEEVKNPSSEYYFEKFKDWTYLIEGDNYVTERIEIQERNKVIVEEINKKYSCIPLSEEKKSSFFLKKYYNENTDFIIHLPIEKFKFFFDDFKESIYINWNDFFMDQSFFSTDEILQIASGLINFNKFIEVKKDWKKEHLYLHCKEICDINEVFKLEVEWDIELIDFVIENYKDERGILSYTLYNNYPYEILHKVLFLENQIKAVNWTIENISKYYDFITEDYYSGETFTQFIDEFYLFKKDWSLNELKKYKNIIDWKILSRTGTFWEKEEILNNFKNEIFYNELLFNENFNFENHFLLQTLNNENISNYKKITLENLIDNGYLITLEIFNIIEKKIDFLKNDKNAFKLVSKGNLAEDLITFLADKLKNEYDDSHEHFIRSGGDLEFYTSGIVSTYWQILSLNPNIVWNDYLITTFTKFLIFESLKNVKISFKTVNEFLNYENSYQFHIYNTRKDGEITNANPKTYFKSILLICNIYDLEKDVFLDNEMQWYGLWFNESKFNDFILKKIT